MCIRDSSAIDAVRCSLDAGAEKAVLAYRRSRLEMPSCDAEFIHAALEGSGFMYLVSPKNISRKGEDAEITCVRNRITAGPDEGDRTRTAVSYTHLEVYKRQRLPLP